MSERPSIFELGARRLTRLDLVEIADGRRQLGLNPDGEGYARLARSAAALASMRDEGKAIYGVTTGFGASADQVVPAQAAAALALNLPRYHGCGVGPELDARTARAVVAVRCATWCGGWSAIRPEVVQRIVELLQEGVTPCIPARGSVGASGDLTPLSYLCTLLNGERELEWQGRRRRGVELLRELGYEPIALGPKESLAIMNGTAVTTAIVGLEMSRLERLVAWIARSTAMASWAMRGRADHFDARIYEAKAHPGSARFASWVRESLEVGDAPPSDGARMQDRYSLRCSPQIAGIALDALEFSDPWLEREMNGAGDNPLIDAERGEALHGGNFYAGHMCFVADGLKTAGANLCDLIERQLLLLDDPSQNGGLPRNLVGVSEGAEAHHGFKAMEITASALTAEALAACMPSSVFSRSTEGHNQDKVSMGSLAARDLSRILDNLEWVVSIHLMAVAQAVELRGIEEAPAPIRQTWAWVRERADFVGADRRMDLDLQRIRPDLRLWPPG